MMQNKPWPREIFTADSTNCAQCSNITSKLDWRYQLRSRFVVMTSSKIIMRRSKLESKVSFLRSPRLGKNLAHGYTPEPEKLKITRSNGTTSPSTLKS